MTITIVFLRSLPILIAVAVVASSVLLVLATSRRGITATGLKKWKPTTRSGFLSPSLIASTERDEVFVAKIHSGVTIASSSLNSFCLSDNSSKIASITKSAFANIFLSTEPEIFESNLAAASGVRRFLSTNF